MAGRRALEGVSMVVVPSRPGPVVPLQSLERGRTDIDEALDELFGEPDDRGPEMADAALLLGGVAAVVVGSVAAWPVAVVIGACAAALGSVLPLRTLWRRVSSGRHASVVRRAIGDGALLRVGDPTLDRLTEAYRSVGAVDVLDRSDRARADAVAHTALREVATLLDARVPTSAAELEYVVSRAQALEALARALRHAPRRDPETERSAALIAARREVERLTGASSVADANDFTAELLGRDAS
jgi:hypothetical protein